MISKEEVKHIAKLARLGLTDKEIKRFQKELSKILDYFALLKKVNTEKTEPSFNPAESFLKEKIRDDEKKPKAKEEVDKLIESVPERIKRHIKSKTMF